MERKALLKQGPKIVILGGGPTGLGAAYRLHELGYENWRLYEKHEYFGGHSTTHTDEKGFLWDEGGHVLFSHYPYFDEFVAKVLKEDFYRHERESWIVLPDARVPYPFQNNLRYLPATAQNECLEGLKELTGSNHETRTFEEWIYATFGEGIARIFMLPYNFRVWAHPLSIMNKEWIAERVSIVDYKRALTNVIEKKDDVAWGPNNTFIFPKYGGTGEIYRRAGALFPQNVHANKEAIKISLARKEITFSDGEVVSYDSLINTIPLTKLADIVEDFPHGVRDAASRLSYNSVIIIGLGIERELQTSVCWEYYPDTKVPFNRLTYFHNYSPHVVPGGDTKRYSSLMLEVCYSKYKQVDKETVVTDSIDALIRYGILQESDRALIVSQAVYDIPYGYPIPTLDRDELLKTVQPHLLEHDVYSRGRYGAWKYEISNMDHCFMQGVESVDAILDRKKEDTWSL